MNTLTAQQQRAVELLRLFFADEAAALYEAHGRSLRKVLGYVRAAASRPGCRELASGLELAKEALAEDFRAQPALTSPGAVADYLKLHFAGQQYESFVVLFLDAQSRLIEAETMFRGTLTQTAVYSREVVRQALVHNAAGVVLSHNHPSGVSEPSAADRMLTDALKEALRVVDVTVLDHIIIAGAASMSFAEHGLL